MTNFHREFKSYHILIILIDHGIILAFDFLLSLHDLSVLPHSNGLIEITIIATVSETTTHACQRAALTSSQKIMISLRVRSFVSS
jgi:hypothetical protein